MKRIFIISIAAITLILLFSACSRKTQLKSVYHTKKYDNIPDSNFYSYYKNYDSNNKIFYIISNDEENIYLQLKVPEKAEQRKILLFGLTIWIDPEAKKKETIGVEFPIKKSPDFKEMRSKIKTGDGTKDENKMLENMIEQSTEYNLIGFYGESESYRKNFSDESPVEVSMNFDSNGFLDYFVSFPKNEIERISSFKDSTMFSIGIESGAMEMPGFGDGPGGGPSGGKAGGGMRPGGGGGMRPGGGRPGGSNQGSGSIDREKKMDEMQTMLTPIELWIKKIELAYISE